MTTQSSSNIPIQAMTTTQLSSLYSVSTKTMNKWLAPHKEKIGKKNGWLYTPKQVSIIFELIGLPTQTIPTKK